MTSAAELSEGFRGQAYLMERAILDVRRHWFSGREEAGANAVAMHEPGGELLALVDASPEDADRFVADAAQRGAYVVSTDFSRPDDLAARLRREGYRSIQRNGVYLYDPRLAPAGDPPARGLLSRLVSRPPLEVQVEMVGAEEIAIWNEVCWNAFGANGSLEHSLAEKRQAFRSMGATGTWFLARVRERAVGVACLFVGAGASQVLAVGTLPAFRGRGVATAVMRRLIASWAEQEGGLLFLDTKPGTPAERLYFGLGFRLAYIRELFARPRRLA